MADRDIKPGNSLDARRDPRPGAVLEHGDMTITVLAVEFGSAPEGCMRGRTLVTYRRAWPDGDSEVFQRGIKRWRDLWVSRG